MADEPKTIGEALKANFDARNAKGAKLTQADLDAGIKSFKEYEYKEEVFIKAYNENTKAINKLPSGKPPAELTYKEAGFSDIEKDTEETEKLALPDKKVEAKDKELEKKNDGKGDVKKGDLLPGWIKDNLNELVDVLTKKPGAEKKTEKPGVLWKVVEDKKPEIDKEAKGKIEKIENDALGQKEALKKEVSEANKALDKGENEFIAQLKNDAEKAKKEALGKDSFTMNWIQQGQKGAKGLLHNGYEAPTKGDVPLTVPVTGPDGNTVNMQIRGTIVDGTFRISDIRSGPSGSWTGVNPNDPANQLELTQVTRTMGGDLVGPGSNEFFGSLFKHDRIYFGTSDGGAVGDRNQATLLALANRTFGSPETAKKMGDIDKETDGKINTFKKEVDVDRKNNNKILEDKSKAIDETAKKEIDDIINNEPAKKESAAKNAPPVEPVIAPPKKGPDGKVDPVAPSAKDTGKPKDSGARFTLAQQRYFNATVDLIAAPETSPDEARELLGNLQRFGSRHQAGFEEAMTTLRNTDRGRAFQNRVEEIQGGKKDTEKKPEKDNAPAKKDISTWNLGDFISALLNVLGGGRFEPGPAGAKGAEGKKPEVKGDKDKGDKPKDAGEKPKDAGDKPKDAGEKPKDAGEKPKDTGEKPKDAGEKPKDAGEKPKDAGEKPKDAGEKPKDAGEKPKDAGDKPKDAGEKPKDAGEKPKDAGEKPKDAGDKPKDAGDKPKDAGEKPKDAGEKPKDAGEKPKDAGDKPKDAGEKPKDAGEKPKDAGEKPKDAGEKPKDAGEKPKDAGEKPKAKEPSKWDVFQKDMKNAADANKKVLEATKAAEDAAKKMKESGGDLLKDVVDKNVKPGLDAAKKLAEKGFKEGSKLVDDAGKKIGDLGQDLSKKIDALKKEAEVKKLMDAKIDEAKKLETAKKEAEFNKLVEGAKEIGGSLLKTFDEVSKEMKTPAGMAKLANAAYKDAKEQYDAAAKEAQKYDGGNKYNGGSEDYDHPDAPDAQKALDKATDKLNEAQKIAEKANAAWVKDIANKAGDALKPGLDAVKPGLDVVNKDLEDGAKFIGDAAKETGAEIIEGAPGALDAAKGVASGAWNTIKKMATPEGRYELADAAYKDAKAKSDAAEKIVHKYDEAVKNGSIEFENKDVQKAIKTATDAYKKVLATKEKAEETKQIVEEAKAKKAADAKETVEAVKKFGADTLDAAKDLAEGAEKLAGNAGKKIVEGAPKLFDAAVNAGIAGIDAVDAWKKAAEKATKPQEFDPNRGEDEYNPPLEQPAKAEAKDGPVSPAVDKEAKAKGIEGAAELQNVVKMAKEGTSKYGLELLVDGSAHIHRVEEVKPNGDLVVQELHWNGKGELTTPPKTVERKDYGVDDLKYYDSSPSAVLHKRFDVDDIKLGKGDTSAVKAGDVKPPSYAKDDGIAPVGTIYNNVPGSTAGLNKDVGDAVVAATNGVNDGVGQIMKGLESKEVQGHDGSQSTPGGPQGSAKGNAK